MKRLSTAALGVSTLALLAAGAVAAAPASAKSEGSERGADKTVVLKANLHQLNGSGASGKATAVVRGEKILQMKVRARGLTPDAPHAQHIHYGEQALNECPTLALDTNKDGRINTVEGVPAYGPVVVSLNTTGPTTPDNFLKVDRFPVSEDGRYTYKRKNIKITDVAGTGYGGAGGTAEQIAESIRDGEGVVVIHGLDYDGNGKYNVSDPEGVSELDGSLPAEATDPAACGVLR